jgi:hypothetical protein
MRDPIMFEHWLIYDSTIIKTIDKMFDSNLFTPMSEEMINKLNYSFIKYTHQDYHAERPIKIIDKKFIEAIYKPEAYSLNYFGFKSDPKDVPDLLKELQKFVNSIVKGIDVRAYILDSNLMQIIMYKYGCFKGVMESSGRNNQQVRDKLKFLKPRKMHKYLKGKYYYVDIVSAYPACMLGIPLSLDSDKMNTKIKELIEKMFTIMKGLKASGSKLVVTLKLLMNSCYGYSMKKSKVFSTKYSDDVMSKGDREFPFVVKYNLKDDGKTGFVSTINTFHQHFNHIQFTKLILDNFHKKVEELEKLVQIYYYNIDSFIIDESGYRTLVENGLIGEEMGMLKVIAIFDEVVFAGPRKWAGKMNCGNIFCRPKQLTQKISYDDFKNQILQS